MIEETNGIRNFFLKFTKVTFPKKSTIISAYSPPNGVYYLDHGYVRMYSSFPDGKELTLNIFKPGSYFPMIWAISDQENNYFFTALTDTQLYKAPKAEIVKYLKLHPDELFLFTRRILSGMAGILNNPEQVFIGSAHQRVISVLMMCAKRFGKPAAGGSVIIDLPMTHLDIANICGLVRETVTLELQKLTSDKIITFERKQLTISSLNRLENMYNNLRE